jgi:hypothetical protein
MSNTYAVWTLVADVEGCKVFYLQSRALYLAVTAEGHAAQSHDLGRAVDMAKKIKA